MARKHYSEEFHQQAGDLYESTPGATLRGIAEYPEIVRGTLRQWLETHGTGKKTAPDGTLTDSSLRSAPRPSTVDPHEPLEQRVARLEAENAQLRAETIKLATELEILQNAANYLAGETRW